MSEPLLARANQYRILRRFFFPFCGRTEGFIFQALTLMNPCNLELALETIKLRLIGKTMETLC